MRFLGSNDHLDPDILDLMQTAQDDSKNATGLTVYLAINYGGRDEIKNAVKQIANKVKSGEISPEEITEDTISEYLYAPGVPDPEMIIRPSGEYRLSNFLIWQGAYSEFWYSDILWPDFKPSHLDKAIEDFNNRNRRFGGV